MIAAALAEDPTTSEGVAQAMRTESIDLTPSINRIMNAGLHEAGAFRAITLFRDSIGVPGDPHRYPDYAIEVGRQRPRSCRREVGLPASPVLQVLQHGQHTAMLGVGRSQPELGEDRGDVLLDRPI